MNCLPQFTIALRRRFTSAAYRPAGTREALPGTICETSVPHFLPRALAAAPTIKESLYPYGSICLTLATSALFTSVSFFSLRMRPGALVPIKWRLPECPRLILPLAVNLKRFLAPRWVFNFNFGFDAFLGIAEILSTILLRRLLRRQAPAPPPPIDSCGSAGGGKSPPPPPPPTIHRVCSLCPHHAPPASARPPPHPPPPPPS